MAVELGLSIANKSRAIASSPKYAKIVADGIRRMGAATPILAASTAEDLGVSTAAGRRRVVGSFTKRIARATKRAKRGGRLAAVNGGAQRLYNSGVDPQQAYDGPILGVAPPQMAAMRRNACMSVAPAGAQPCSTSLIAWRLGSGADPAVREPLRQVSLWRRIWNTTPQEQRADIKKAWRRAVPKILLHGIKWSKVTGTLQATVATLAQLGWVPSAPSRWATPCRSHYADLDDQAPEAGALIEQAVRLSAENAAWASAAQHHLGGGLQEGIPSMGPAREARSWLIRHKRPTEVKALDAIVCGGIWHGGRNGLRRHCRCGQLEFPFHRYWSCPLLPDLVDENGRNFVGRLPVFPPGVRRPSA